MLPKEHGAYGQMALPLATSLVVTRASLPALLLAAAVVAGFLAHEPLLVLLGRRGGRAQRESGRRAARWFAVEVLVLAAAGLGGLSAMAPEARWSLALPLLPAGGLAAAIAAGREKSLAAEIAVAAAFSLVAVPLCGAAGVATRAGVAIAAVFGSMFVTGTLAVRGIIATTRGGGDPRLAQRLRIAAFLLSGAAMAGLATAGLRQLLPWSALFAAVPGLGVAAGLALLPPPPTRLRRVGWTLVATSVAAAVVLAIGLTSA